MAKKMNDPDVQAGDVAPEENATAAASPAKRKGRFSTYDVWRMEWKGMGDDRKLVRDKVKKTVKILDEHASILNEQRENTLLEYVKKGG